MPIHNWRLETLRVETLQHDERQDYLTLHGVIDQGNADAAALFLVHDDRIEVLGAGRQPSYELNTLRSE